MAAAAEVAATCVLKGDGGMIVRRLSLRVRDDEAVHRGGDTCHQNHHDTRDVGRLHALYFEARQHHLHIGMRDIAKRLETRHKCTGSMAGPCVVAILSRRAGDLGVEDHHLRQRRLGQREPAEEAAEYGAYGWQRLAQVDAICVRRHLVHCFLQLGVVLGLDL